MRVFHVQGCAWVMSVVGYERVVRAEGPGASGVCEGGGLERGCGVFRHRVCWTGRDVDGLRHGEAGAIRYRPPLIMTKLGLLDGQPGGVAWVMAVCPGWAMGE